MILGYSYSISPFFTLTASSQNMYSVVPNNIISYFCLSVHEACNQVPKFRYGTVKMKNGLKHACPCILICQV